MAAYDVGFAGHRHPPARQHAANLIDRARRLKLGRRTGPNETDARVLQQMECERYSGLRRASAVEWMLGCTMKNTEELLGEIARGECPEYLYFWGHQQSRSGAVGKSCLSQWYEAPFALEGAIFPTAEHYMMVSKAQLFGDVETRKAILSELDPQKAKALGRGVLGFDEAVWLEHRWGIVVQANTLKFAQNEALRRFLLDTGTRVLVEASPVDRIWGIGLAADAPGAADPAKWQGLNLLGYALMEVRASLRSDAVQQIAAGDAAPRHA